MQKKILTTSIVYKIIIVKNNYLQFILKFLIKFNKSTHN